MQINLPIESMAPEPPPPHSAPSPSQSEGKQSFEHFLDSGENSPAAKKPSAETACPSAEQPAVAVGKGPAKVDDQDVDPNVAAAALAGVPLPPLPPPVTESPAKEVLPETLAALTPLPPAAVAPPALPVPTVNTAAAASAASSSQPLSDQVEVNPAVPPDPTEPATPLAIKIPDKPTKSEAAQQGETEDAPETPAAPTTNTPLSLARPKSGTPAAMDRSTMSNALPSRTVRTKAAGISITDKAPSFAKAVKPAISVTPVAVRPVAAAADAPTSTDTQPSVSLAQPAGNNAQPTTDAAPAETAMKAERVTQDASLTLDHVERLTENMKTSGSHQMELEVRLHDDSKVTISLQMERGELKTTFKTDSTELRDALANNWGQVSDKNNDRSIRLTPPVFESSDARHGFSGDSRQQGRDGRAYSQEKEGQPFTYFASAKPAAKVVSTSSPTASGLALYA